MSAEHGSITLSPLQRLITALLVSSCICVGSYFGWFRSLDWIVYDTSQRLAERVPADDIVIIAIDDASIAALGRWPWSRAIHAQLVDRLTEAGARAVVLDILFSDPQRSASGADQAMARAIQRAKNVFLPLHIAPVGHGGQLRELFPIEALRYAAAGLGHVHFEVDDDGVCRSVFLREGVGEPNRPHLAVSLAAFLRGEMQHRPEIAPSSTPSAPYISRAERRLIPFGGVEQWFQHLAYVDVLQGKIKAESLHDKIVFVGATAAGLGDRVVTPTSSAERILTGVELNATIFDALRNDRFIKSLQLPGQLVFNFIAAFLIVLCSAFLAPRPLLIFTGATLTGVNLVALVLPVGTGLWVDPTSATAACIISYLFWSLRRMQQALRFLQNELHALASERSFLQKPDHFDDLYSGLRFAADIAPVVGWYVTQNGRKLVSWGKCEGMLAQPSTDRRWLHQEGVSICSLENSSGHLGVVIVWEEGRVAAQKVWPLLDALVAHFNDRPSITLPKAPEAITHTIQDLQRASDAYKEVSHLAQRSLSRLADGVAITDLSGRLLFENLQFRGLLRIGAEGSHQNILDRIVTLTPTLGASWSDLLEPVYCGHKTAQCEAVTLSGVQVLFQAHALNTDSNEHYVIIILTDISVLKEYEQARTETLNFLSHDLRSPLVSILALIENARSHSSADNDPQLLTAIESYARSNLRFAENFLQLARAEATDSMNFEPVDMHGVLEQVLVDARTGAATGNIELRASYCDEDAWVTGSADLLQRTVANLLSNAIKYSQPGGVVNCYLAVEGDWVTCRVQDQGVGISEEDLPHIFERFQRGSTPDIEHRKGAGLGLRFVKVVVQRHGGEVTVTSELNKGSVFTLKLPLVTL